MDQLLFFRRFLRAPGRVGSLLPSSRRLAARVVAAVPWERCPVVAELGSGTGAITQLIWERLPPGSRLLLFEADPDFRRLLAHRFPGVPIYPDAAHLDRALAEQGLPAVAAVISGLPFATLPPPVRTAILDQVAACLAPGGVLVAYQYAPVLWWLARSRFARVQVGLEPWNLPPAFVIRCQKAGP